MLGQAIGAVWVLASGTFLVLVALTIRKARARGRRLFRDEPTARVKALSHPTDDSHIWDVV